MPSLQLLIVNTRLRIACVLLFIWIIYLLFHPSKEAFFLPLFSTAIVVALDLFITYIRSRTLYLPAPSLVTGLLIGLIIAPTQQWYVFVVASLIAVLSKQLLRAKMHQHIFNPAALGILGSALLFHIPVAWWAVAWEKWIVIAILGVAYTLYELKRLWLPLTFLLTYGLYLVATAPNPNTLLLLIDGTVFLFAFVMLPEPITSIATGKWKYFFGPLVAAIVIVLEKGIGGALPDIFLPALLFGNLIGFLSKRVPR